MDLLFQAERWQTVFFMKTKLGLHVFCFSKAELGRKIRDRHELPLFSCKHPSLCPVWRLFGWSVYTHDHARRANMQFASSTDSACYSSEWILSRFMIDCRPTTRLDLADIRRRKKNCWYTSYPIVLIRSSSPEGQLISAKVVNPSFFAKTVCSKVKKNFHSAIMVLCLPTEWIKEKYHLERERKSRWSLRCWPTFYSFDLRKGAKVEPWISDSRFAYKSLDRELIRRRTQNSLPAAQLIRIELKSTLSHLSKRGRYQTQNFGAPA